MLVVAWHGWIRHDAGAMPPKRTTLRKPVRIAMINVLTGQEDHAIALFRPPDGRRATMKLGSRTPLPLPLALRGGVCPWSVCSLIQFSGRTPVPRYFLWFGFPLKAID